ncbi:MAG: Ig-like domain-containing protein [Bacteroidota bacterium]
MMPVRFHFSKVFSGWLLLATLFYACDRWEDDTIAELPDPSLSGNTDDKMVTLPSSPVLIDLTTRLPVGTPVTFRLHGNAKRGETTLLEGGQLRYTPHASFQSGLDSIPYQLIEPDSSVLTEDALVIQVTSDSSDLPCPTVLPDHAWTNSDQSIDLAVLQNDIFCSTLPDTSSLEIATFPRYGTASTGNFGIINYTPEPGFQGVDSLVYRICLTDNPPTCLLAQVVIEVGRDSVVTDTCHWQLRDDVAHILPGDTAHIDVLANDQLCLSRDSVIVTTTPAVGVDTWTDENQNVYLVWYGDTAQAVQVPYQVCLPDGDCLEAFINVGQSISDTVDVCYPPVDDEFYLDSATVFPVVLPILANDNFCDNTPAVELSEPSSGIVTFESNSLLFTSTDPNVTTVTLSYQLCTDDLSYCSEAWVTIHLKDSADSVGSDPNCTFQLEDDYFSSDSIGQNTSSWELPVLANDVLCQDTIPTLSVVQSPSHGTTAIIDQQILYTLSDTTYVGQDSFTYQVCPSDGEDCKVATVVVEFKEE